MKTSPELLRLYRIIKNSDRVRKARALFGVAKDEYIITFVNKQTRTTKANGPEGRKVSSGVSDLRYMHDHIAPYIQKEIIEYFGLELDAKTVQDAIFWKRAYIPQSFHCRIRVNKAGNFEATFEFFEQPNADARKEIAAELEESLRLLEGFFKTKNTKGLQTSDKSYTQVKTLRFFDEKYDIAMRYRKLMLNTETAPAERKKLLVDLVEETKVKLHIKAAFTNDGLRKIVDEFENYFGEVITA